MATDMSGVGENRSASAPPPPPYSPPILPPRPPTPLESAIATPHEYESAPPREPTPDPPLTLAALLSRGIAPSSPLPRLAPAPPRGSNLAAVPFQAPPPPLPPPPPPPPPQPMNGLPVMYAPPPPTLPPDVMQMYMHWQDPAPRQQARIISDATQFKDIAPYIDSGVDEHGTPVLLDLQCACCGYHLDVPERVSPNRFYSDAALEPFAVLPCGHLVGAHCLDQWVRRRVDDAREPPNCPLCRFELLHPRCSCLVRTPAYCPRLSRPEQLPLTLPEGGRVADRCAPCRERRADRDLRAWLEEYLPAHSAEGSLSRAQERRLNAVIGGLARSARGWHQEHIPRW